MSDYRDPNDPMYGNRGYEPADRTGTSWGWIAGAVFLVIVLALAFGVGHEPTRVASNNTSAQQAKPSEGQPSMLPGLTPPPLQAPNRP
jgi:hypothetical protein